MPAMTDDRLVFRAKPADLINISLCADRLAAEGQRFITRSSAIRAALAAFAGTVAPSSAAPKAVPLGTSKTTERVRKAPVDAAQAA
jgi:hypothetical protein